MKYFILQIIMMIANVSFAEKGMNVLTGTNISGSMSGESKSKIKSMQYSFDAYYSPQKVIKKTGVIFGKPFAIFSSSI